MILLLNGPSSSGKSTLARALQAQLPCAIVSIDDFLPMSAGEPIYEDDVFAVSGELCAAAAQLAKTNPCVVVDHVITSPRIFEQFLRAMEPHPVHLVRVTCPPEELLRREALRGNRCPGTARASLDYLYPQTGYDLTVDTFQSTPEECARQIAELVHPCPRSSAFPD